MILRHSFNGKSLAAERVGKQVLQGFHLVPSAFLRCLDDTRLLHSPKTATVVKPTHVLVSGTPINVVPFFGDVGSRTSRRIHRHLLCFLCWFFMFSRHPTPLGSLPTFASDKIVRMRTTARIHPITGRRLLFPNPIPASPSICLTASLPSRRKERYGLTTFPMIDTMKHSFIWTGLRFSLYADEFV